MTTYATTPDGVPIVEVRRVGRVCILCGRDHCVLTDDPARRGESVCLFCRLSATLLTGKPGVRHLAS